MKIYLIFILLFFGFLQCSDDRPIKEFHYPNRSLSPEVEKVSPQIKAIKTFYCDRYYQRGDKFFPNENSCRLSNTKTFKNGYLIKDVGHPNPYGWSETNYKYTSSGILIEKHHEGSVFGEEFTTLIKNQITDTRIVKTEHLDRNSKPYQIYNFEYDEKGYLVKIISTNINDARRGFQRMYEYNSKGDISKILGSNNRVYKYEYDKGEWVYRSSGDTEVYREFDFRGNLIDSKTYTNGNLEYHQYWIYDSNNLLESHATKSTIYVEDFYEIDHYADYDVYGNWRLSYTTRNGVLSSEITKREIIFR